MKKKSSKALSQEEYINSKINVVFQPMISQMVLSQPKDPIKYMIDWLLKFSGEKQNTNLKSELNFLRKINSSKANSDNSSESSSDKDDSNDEFDFDILKLRNKLISKKTRSSVSAEVYGIFNPEKIISTIPRNNNIKNKEEIKEILKQNFLLSSLSEKDFEFVINAMEIVNYKQNETVIKEGDEGNNFYVVQSGILECYKNNKIVKVYEKNDSFGELALLYYTPRQATIIAKTDSVLLSLDRVNFTQIVKDNAIKRKEMCKKFLKSVPILSQFSPYEINQILEAVRVKKYKKNDYNNLFNYDIFISYILESGEVEAIKDGVIVKQYSKGGYFGELALLKGDESKKRAADIIVLSDECCVLELDKKSFKRLLGPIEDILQKNTNSYNNINFNTPLY